MKKILSLIFILCFTSAVYAKENYNELTQLMENIMTSQLKFIESIEKAKTGGELIAIFTSFEEILTEYSRKIAEFEEKHPWMKDSEKKVPEEMKKIKSRYDETREKLAQSLVKVLAQYTTDEKVMNAYKNLSKKVDGKNKVPAGSGISKYEDVITFLKNMIEIQKEVIEQLGKSKDADEAVDTIKSFAKKISSVKQEAKELEKKYPELKDDKTIPAELKEIVGEMMAQVTKLGDAFQKLMTRFPNNEKISKAIQDMASQLQ